MIRIRSTILISLIAFGLAGAVALAAIRMIRSAPFGMLPDASMLEEIRDYRTWMKVNPRRERMAIVTALLCSAPPRYIPRWRTTQPLPGAAPEDRGTRLPQNPHDTAFILVYVNAAGCEAMMTQLHPAFPAGSIIVKEKYASATSADPELLTVMVKHGRGYDSARGDWEYMVVNGRGTSIEARGRLGTCYGCHREQVDDDHIFRTYLPHDILQTLR